MAPLIGLEWQECQRRRVAGLARNQNSVRAKRHWQALSHTRQRALSSCRANGDLPSTFRGPLSTPTGIRVIIAGGAPQSAGAAPRSGMPRHVPPGPVYGAVAWFELNYLHGVTPPACLAAFDFKLLNHTLARPICILTFMIPNYKSTTDGRLSQVDAYT